MTTLITLRTDFDVELVDSMGDDARIVGAARVSTAGAGAAEEESSGLIGFLMKNRHGSPFEHVVFTWRISAPIFVWREFHRHRIASYNEESGRYKKLDPVFYIPPANRDLIQKGKAGSYTFEPGSAEQAWYVGDRIIETSLVAYSNYEAMLASGVAREVARMCLPVNIYSTCYVTMNARALMNFLSLRVRSDMSTYPSTPMREINEVANAMQMDFSDVAPLTFASFNSTGRVAP